MPKSILILLVCITSTFCFLNLNTSSSLLCPRVMFSCSAVDFQTTLRWFFNEDEFATYAYRSIDEYPLTVLPDNETYNSLVGGVDIQILEARLNEDNPSATFLSNMTVNISALQSAGVTIVSCGSFAQRSSLSITFNPNRVPPPTPMGISVQPEYSMDLQLTRISVDWNEVISKDKYCIYLVNYTVVLESEMKVVLMKDVDSESCRDGVCSTSLSLSTPMNESYRVSVIATNMFGSSDSSFFDGVIDASIESPFSHSLAFMDCVTTVTCSTTKTESGNCTVQYGEDPFYQNFGAPITGPLNSSFLLPDMELSTLYFIQIMFMQSDSEHVILRRNYTTGNGGDLCHVNSSSIQHYTLSNILLMVTGFLMYSVAIAISLSCACILCKGQYHKSLSVIISSFRVRFLVLLSIAVIILTTVLWVLAIYTVESQANSCDLEWQSRRNNLIYISLAFSVVSFVITTFTIAGALALHCARRKGHQGKMGLAAPSNKPHYEEYSLPVVVNPQLEVKKNVAYGQV